jgi:tryptophan synthase alpha chain
MTMTRTISETFAHCRLRKNKALVPFLTSGFPDDHAFVELIGAMSDSGADLIEIGIPFSDPLADGRTIQKSSQMALANGVNIEKTFQFIKALKGQNPPLILMTYFNLVHHYGIERFIRSAQDRQVRGLIIPDLIPEEGRQMEALCHSHQIDLIYMLAPTTGTERSRMILNRSRGFVYLVTVAGVTGARSILPEYLPSWISDVKHRSPLPVCVGFGISSVSQARQVARYADGVIVGSALIDIIMSANARRTMIAEVSKFIGNLKRGLNNE